VAPAPSISIIIPTYNRSRLLIRALEAIRGESLPAERFEVIISDDGSSDGTEALVKSFVADYKIKYHFQEDRGFRAAAARNAGAGLAEGDVLLFLDAGQLPGPRFAESHLSSHASLSSMHAAVIGPMYGYFADNGAFRNDDGHLTAEEIFRLIPKNTDPRYKYFAGIEFDMRRSPLPLLFFWTGNCSVNTDDFWSAGGFDEGFQEWGIEDTDLAYRLWERGATFAVCQEGWAIEQPRPRDKDAELRSMARNIERYLQDGNFVTPARELLALLVDVSADIPQVFEAFDVFLELQGHYRALTEWQAQARGINVLEEVENFCQASLSGARVAILGVGSSIPESRPNAALFDFDREFCQVSDRAVLHRIGLRTGLADNSVDSLLITSRMRGIWERLGDPIMAEVKRVADDVHLAWH
jgi:GT2 family glycosyltransferase